MLTIETFTLGPVQTNTYLVSDLETKLAVIVDPAWDGQFLAGEVEKRGLTLDAVWLTHAHFDHFAGVAGIYQVLKSQEKVILHPEDLPLWKLDGGAPLFGMFIKRGPVPSVLVKHGDVLTIASYLFEVRHAPGHTPGHVLYYCASEKLLFCGDVIFGGSIGRTDLPGGSYQILMKSIAEQVMTLPDDTRLLSGHGPETSVGEERLTNPFLT